MARSSGLLHGRWKRSTASSGPSYCCNVKLPHRRGVWGIFVLKGPLMVEFECFADVIFLHRQQRYSLNRFEHSGKSAFAHVRSATHSTKTRKTSFHETSCLRCAGGNALVFSADQKLMWIVVAILAIRVTLTTSVAVNTRAFRFTDRNNLFHGNGVAYGTATNAAMLATTHK